MAIRIPALGNLTERQDKFTTYVAQGFSYDEACRRAGFENIQYTDQLMNDINVLKSIAIKIRDYRKDIASVELLSKGKRRLNELMDSGDERIVLGAASAVLKAFSGPGRKTLLEKAIEEDYSVQNIAAIAKKLLPATHILETKLIEGNGRRVIIAEVKETPQDPVILSPKGDRIQ